MCQQSATELLMPVAEQQLAFVILSVAKNRVGMGSVYEERSFLTLDTISPDRILRCAQNDKGEMGGFSCALRSLHG